MPFRTCHLPIVPRRSTILRLACRCLLLATLLTTTRQASAEFFQFDTSTTILTGYIPPLSTITLNGTAATQITTPAPNSIGITFIGDASASPGDNYDGTGSGSDIVFANISISGLTRFSTLETVSIPYTIVLRINDYNSATSGGILGTGTFDLTGTLSGTVGKTGGGKQVNLTTNTFSGSNVLTKTIGNEVYTLSLLSFVPPGPTNAGALGAHITATHVVPEPSSIALFACGALALATPALRRWRRKTPSSSGSR